MSLEQSIRLLEIIEVHTGRQVFFAQPESSGLETEITLPYGDWVAFGKPSQFTVTFRPGDELNIEEDS